MKEENSLQKAIEFCKKGGDYSQKKSYSIALQYFDKAEPILQTHQNNDWLAFLNHQKFFCFLALEKMEESQSSAQTAIEMYKKMGNEESLVSILINFIDFWNKKKDLQQAFFYAKLAEAIVEKKNYSSSGLLYQKLAQLYNKQMFSTKSIRYYTKAIEKFADLDKHNKSFCLYEKAKKNIFSQGKVTSQRKNNFFFLQKDLLCLSRSANFSMAFV